MPNKDRSTPALIVMISFLAAVGPLSIDMYLPSLPTVTQAFGTTASLTQISVSAFFLGLALGQLIYGPLSDRYGRRPALLLGMGLYLVASIACVVAQRIELLIAARALQGLGAASSSSAGRAIVRDKWAGDRAARAMSFLLLVMSLAPLVAPLLGGQILQYLGWRGNFWVLTGFAVLALVMVTFWLPETNGRERRGNTTTAQVFKAYGYILRDPLALAWLAAAGLIDGLLFAYITSAAFIYIGLFDIDPQSFGLYFGLNVVGLIVGNFLNSRLVERYGYRRMTAAGIVVAILASSALLIATLLGAGNLLAVSICLFLAIGTVGLIAGNTMVGLLDLYPRNSGASSALFGMSQYGIGFLSSVAVGLLHTDSPLAMAGVMTVSALGTGACFLLVRHLERRKQEASANRDMAVTTSPCSP